MCGVAGFRGILQDGMPSDSLLQNMIGTIRHRGPDAQGIHVEEGVGLAHARLSIIDLADGAQPMSNGDGTVWISFNGEIFNYIELREELMARGRRFRTKSDTEVIIHLYELMGPSCVEKLNGDFAFAIWDGPRKRLMLARDRMGVRPLFFAQRSEGLFFASEVKALLEVPEIEAQLDPYALDQIFTMWFPLAPRTIFKDINELQPAHFLLADEDGIRIKRYWQLDYPDAEKSRHVERPDEKKIAQEVRELLSDATRIRLRSDVPVGAYLSGGLDSSIITALVKEISPAHLNSYSVTFEDTEFDESAYQQLMVEALDTEHQQILCSKQGIGRDFGKVVYHTERPVLRTAPAPLFTLSGLVQENNRKVVLTGEGADEVFAGYDIFLEAKVRRFCARQPNSQFRPLLFKRLYPYLPGIKGQSVNYLKRFFSVQDGELNDSLFSHMPRFKTTRGTKVFYSDALREELKDYDALEELRDSLPSDFTRWEPLSQAQFLETAYLLPYYILASQGDRVAMAHSIEGRFPFLDHRVVELGARIPSALKVKGLREKNILREAMKDILPDQIANRPKQPYRAPDSQSFSKENKPDYLDNILSPEALEESGCFDATAVGKLSRKSQERSLTSFRDNMAFVGVVSTQLWVREFGSKS